jgi:hypothetical protein
LCRAQDVNPLARVLTFEADPTGKNLTGWSAPSGASLDGDIVHGGKFSARIERKTGDDRRNP